MQKARFEFFHQPVTDVSFCVNNNNFFFLSEKKAHQGDHVLVLHMLTYHNLNATWMHNSSRLHNKENICRWPSHSCHPITELLPRFFSQSYTSGFPKDRLSHPWRQLFPLLSLAIFFHGNTVTRAQRHLLARHWLAGGGNKSWIKAMRGEQQKENKKKAQEEGQ